MPGIKEAMKQAKSNIEIEGVTLNLEKDKLIKKILQKEITEKDYKNKVLEMIKK